MTLFFKDYVNYFLFFFVCIVVTIDVEASVTQHQQTAALSGPSMSAKVLEEDIITPTLRYLGMDTLAARKMLLTTAAQESRLGQWKRAIRGDALGIYQMEPATHDDIWKNFLKHRPEMAKLVKGLLIPGFSRKSQLVWNIPYATAMARMHYLRVKAPLPAAHSPVAQAHYWKKYYNTHLGRGTISQFMTNYRDLVKPHVKFISTYRGRYA